MTEHTNLPNSIAPSDSDFDDLDLFAGVATEAQKYADDAAESQSKAPVSYLDEGTYWLRFLPEIRVTGGARKLEFKRHIWSHTGIKGVRRLPAGADANCPVRREVMRLKESRHTSDDAWKYQAKEEAVVRVQLFKVSENLKKSKFIKIGVPMFLVLRRRDLIALSNFIAETAPADLKRILNPNHPAPLTRLVSGKNDKGFFTAFSHDLEEAALEPLSEDFPSMWDMVLDESKLPTDADLRGVKQFVNQLLAANTNFMNPAAGGDDAGNMPPGMAGQPTQGSARSAVADALSGGRGGVMEPKEEGPEKTIPILPDPSTQGGAGGTCPSKTPGLAWAKHNSAEADCVLCPNEGDCAEATLKAATDIPY